MNVVNPTSANRPGAKSPGLASPRAGGLSGRIRSASFLSASFLSVSHRSVSHPSTDLLSIGAVGMSVRNADFPSATIPKADPPNSSVPKQVNPNPDIRIRCSARTRERSPIATPAVVERRTATVSMIASRPGTNSPSLVSLRANALSARMQSAGLRIANRPNADFLSIGAGTMSVQNATTLNATRPKAETPGSNGLKDGRPKPGIRSSGPARTEEPRIASRAVVRRMIAVTPIGSRQAANRATASSEIANSGTASLRIVTGGTIGLRIASRSKDVSPSDDTPRRIPIGRVPSTKPQRPN